MLKRGILITAILLIPSMLVIANSSPQDKWVDKIGQMLASWSYAHQTTIRINGKPISFTGGTLYIMRMEQTADGPRKVCRGSVTVFWQTDQATAEDNQTVRENLRSMVETNDCDVQMLLTYTDKLNAMGNLKQLDAERLAHDWKCLGNFEFTPIKIN